LPGPGWVRYWPEFAAAGKEGVQVRHVLAHTAGLPDFDGPLSAADLYDWPGVTARLADPDARMTVSYVMNQMLDQGQGDYRGLGIVMAAYQSLP
jgi:CubicO group peptidase (beta-lactamase class C family)